MDSVERVKQLCKGKGISLAKLERECGFSNGYISALREGKMPADRLQKVADYFGVSTRKVGRIRFITLYLLTGVMPETEEEYYSPEAKEIMQDIHDREDLRALFHVAKKASPEYNDFVRAFLEKMVEKESK